LCTDITTDDPICLTWHVIEKIARKSCDGEGEADSKSGLSRSAFGEKAKRCRVSRGISRLRIENKKLA